MSEQQTSKLTLNDFYAKLNARVSDYNAKLMLQSVKIGAGIESENDVELDDESATTVCLELIKQGGPAFQVGREVYKTLH